MTQNKADAPLRPTTSAPSQPRSSMILQTFISLLIRKHSMLERLIFFLTAASNKNLLKKDFSLHMIFFKLKKPGHPMSNDFKK